MGSKNVDRLSSLPEEIQSHILSLMPTKFAVQTGILSKRWRYTWMLITNLDFDDKPPIVLSSIETFVDRVLGFCKTSQLQSLRLDLTRRRVQKSSVSSWIYKAILLNVRELDIRVNMLEIPSSLFTCTTLTKLRICRGDSYAGVWKCPPVVNLPCLKTLDVAVSGNPFVNAFKLISGCPMLENLSLDVAMHDDYIFDIPTLKRLKLTLLCSSSTNKVFLHVPNLEHLFFVGWRYPLFVMKDVSSLVEASISFYKNSFDNMAVELLKGISGVELLSLQKLQGSRWIAPELVPTCMLAKLTIIKFLSFKWRRCDKPFLKFLLRNAKVLKTVTISLENSSMEEEMWLSPQFLNLPRASKCCEIHFHRN